MTGVELYIEHLAQVLEQSVILTLIVNQSWMIADQ
jgi:hypothetical protein